MRIKSNCGKEIALIGKINMLPNFSNSNKMYLDEWLRYVCIITQKASNW